MVDSTTSQNSQTGDSESSTLVAQLRSRDAAAWIRFSDLYGPVVYGWARRAGLQDSNAADVMQEVFQAVSQRIADFRRDKSNHSFRGWLWGITHHKIADQFRCMAAQPDAQGGTEFHKRLSELAKAEAVEKAPSDEMGCLARRALALIRQDFHEPTWQAFERAVLHGQSAAEVAATLGISVGSVYTAKCRVLARLRQELADSFD